MTAGEGRERPPRRRALSVRSAIVLTGILLAAFLAVPMATATAKYLNDVFIFLDGAYRIALGQVPNVDFHSSLGPLAYYVPALGYALTGSLGAAMPVGMALLTAAMAAVAAHVIGSRMQPAIGLPLALYLLLIVAAPMNPGESVRELSFAMFYNRVGWAALGLIFVMYLPPTKPRRYPWARDATSAALLLLLMLYLKISYGLVGLAFLLFLLSDRQQWRWVAAAIAATASAILLIEIAWGGTASHLGDLALAGAVSGGTPNFRALVEVADRNLPEFAIYVLFILILLAVRRRLRDILFAAGCAGSGLLLIEQNFQLAGILTLGAAAAVMAEAAARSDRVRTPALSLLLAAYLAPAIVTFALATGLHSLHALARSGDPIPLPGYSDLRLVRLWTGGAHPMFVRYNVTLADGARVLEEMDGAGRVLVLDFVGPFSAGLGLEPAHLDSTWYHWGRTIDSEHHPDADRFFANARIVMDPKEPIERWTADGLRRVYEDALRERYRLFRETELWRVYVARGASSHSSSPPSITVTRQSTTAQP